MRDKFAVTGFMFYPVEILRYTRYTVGIAYSNNGVCQVFRRKIQVVNSFLTSDDQFSFADWTSHNYA